jgi:hypothetical protein
MIDEHSEEESVIASQKIFGYVGVANKMVDLRCLLKKNFLASIYQTSFSNFCFIKII